MKAWKKFARTLVNHCGKGHKLRVVSLHGSDDHLVLECVFCGVPLAMGCPGVINELVEILLESGNEVWKPDSALSSVRIH